MSNNLKHEINTFLSVLEFSFWFSNLLSSLSFKNYILFISFYFLCFNFCSILESSNTFSTTSEPWYTIQRLSKGYSGTTMLNVFLLSVLNLLCFVFVCGLQIHIYLLGGQVVLPRTILCIISSDMYLKSLLNIQDNPLLTYTDVWS